MIAVLCPDKEKDEKKEYHQPLNSALILPHGPTDAGVGRQRKRGERGTEK